MKPSPNAIPLRLQVSLGKVREEHLDRAAGQLRNDLHQIPGLKTRDAVQKASPKAKSPEALTLGAFVLAVAPELIKQAVSVLIAWLREDSRRSIEIRHAQGKTSYTVSGTWDAKELEDTLRLLSQQRARAKGAS
jgi:hypothetical protein